ncbi:expressed unknown protein [Ectocarpus siliculosus]|uniref:Uncharacterized protein n=1 Tax=Ectocarpus siliculosus TaxID=2880 RepID=D7FHC2_ECTSI|nr:expressed unknown protein [Ectocarpus siliculosus]|eukprot:CBJ28489.1 expressed unknown protein [Ectocarpus siliculosus]
MEAALTRKIPMSERNSIKFLVQPWLSPHYRPTLTYHRQDAVPMAIGSSWFPSLIGCAVGCHFSSWMWSWRVV